MLIIWQSYLLSIGMRSWSHCACFFNNPWEYAWCILSVFLETQVLILFIHSKHPSTSWPSQMVSEHIFLVFESVLYWDHGPNPVFWSFLFQNFNRFISYHIRFERSSKHHFNYFVVSVAYWLMITDSIMFPLSWPWNTLFSFLVY